MSDISMISTMRSRSGKGVSHSVSDCSARAGRPTLVEELLRISPVGSGHNPPVTFLNGAPDPARLPKTRASCGPCGHCDGPPELQIPCAALLEETKLMACDLDAGSYGVSTLRPGEPCYISTSTSASASASSTHSRSPCLVTERPDLPLAAVVAVLLLCYCVNHIPVLGLTVAESFLPGLLPAGWPVSWLPLWAGLLEGVLLPVVLAMTDKTFVRRVAAIYSRRRPLDMTKPPQGLHGKFRPFNNCVVESHRPMETVRFPITNGSLFTSLDGRIPIIHNYRRTKGVRTTGALPSYCLNQGLAQRYCPPPPPPQEDRERGSQLRANLIVADMNRELKSEPQEAGAGQCYTQRLTTADLRRDSPAPPPPFPQNIQQLRETLFMEAQDSEDEYEGYEGYEGAGAEPIYATLSSRSACSATTAANDDFEFYQQESPTPAPSSGRSPSIRRRISRSSSIDRILSRQETDEDGSQSGSDGGRPQRPTKYRQQPPPPRRSRLVRPLSRLPPTPPPPRRPRLAPVLSVDSLVAALHQADVSYLDTGDLCQHADRPPPPRHGGSVPDLKRVFYTGFL